MYRTDGEAPENLPTKKGAQALISERLKNDGDAGIIYLQRRGELTPRGRVGNAHAINVENIHGEIWFFDTSKGLAYKGTPGPLLKVEDVSKNSAASILNKGVA